MEASLADGCRLNKMATVDAYKVNNAITTQLLISRYSPTEICSIAPAGAVEKTVGIGDLVVAEKVFQHDFGTVKPYGFVWGKAPDGTGFEEEGYSELPGKGFPAGLIKTLDAAHGGQVFFGPLVTGDQFIASREKRDWLSKKFNALAVDMTAAAIAQTCFANGIPCRVLRIVTDQADEAARSNFENVLQPGIDRTDYQKLTRVLLGTR
jgi:adenosylhomocysteine nucleosidase